MDLLQQFKNYIKKEQLFQQQDLLLLAVSGGVDSSVLCALCAASGLQFAVAHCNFQLRGDESDRDEAFVKELASKYGVEFFIKKFDTLSVSKQNKTSVEETARVLRYAWFSELMAEKGYHRLLTAHHADDNRETVMMNFFRGTGIRGMRGILPKQKNIVRPLLFADRADIEEYASSNGIGFVTDRTNAENDHTRNFFRNELIPAVEKIFPKTKENISANIERFRDAEYLYNESIVSIKNKLEEKKGNEIHIPVLKLAKAKPLQAVIHEIIKEYGFTAAQTPEVEKLLTASSGKYILSGTHRILKNRNWLIISALQQDAGSSYYLIEKDTGSMKFPGGEMRFEHFPASVAISADAGMAHIDADLLSYPLLLRRPKQGDYFYPLGMKKKKKLSRFFGDIKLSLIQKEHAWVLESDKKIIWVIGYRMDDRFKITARSTNMLRPVLLPGGQKY